MSLGEMINGETINMILKTLPVGFRFCPTDEELVDHHLRLKIQGMNSQVDFIPVVDVCKWEPWELPDFSVIKTNDPEWFFFSLLDYKYSKGSRCKRTTNAGYWKVTGKDQEIKSETNKEVIGTKKFLVFYEGHGHAAVKTSWVIHEYRANIAGLPANRAYVLCRLKRKTDENTGSDIPTPDEAVAGTGIHHNGPANDTTLGAGPSHHSSNIASDIRNYQIEDMTIDEHSQLQGLLNDFTFTPPDSDWFSDKEQRLDLDLPFPSGFKNSYGSVQFQDRVDTEFADSLIVVPGEYHCEGLTSQRSSAVYSGNLNHGSVSRLSARPQSPLKGVYGKGGGSNSNTNTRVPQVQYGLSQQASSREVPSLKECMQSPMAQQQQATSGLSSISQHRKENKSFLHDESRRLDNFVAQWVDPKGVKLAGNVSNNEILLAKLSKLSCIMTEPEENSVSIKAKDRTEYGSVTDLLQNKNPIRESKKDCKITEKANPKLSSIWNEPVGINQKSPCSSPETASAGHDPSSSPGYLVNLVVGILLFVVLIAVMVLDIIAKVQKPFS